MVRRRIEWPRGHVVCVCLFLHLVFCLASDISCHVGSPANFLRLDVSTPDTAANKSLVLPGVASTQEQCSPLQFVSVAEEPSGSTMCVLSQDNESKRIFERLYETGITSVKRKIEHQEEKRSKDAEVPILIDCISCVLFHDIFARRLSRTCNSIPSWE